MKRWNVDLLSLLGVAGGIIALDQWTKYLVRTNLDLTEYWSPWVWLTPYARVVHWKNTGTVLGLFQDRSMVFLILAIMVSAAIIYYFPRIPRSDWPLRIAMLLQLGGALGNVIDRITLGYVLDFISIWRFPVFNIADASITLGVVVLIVGMIIHERRSKLTPPVPLDEAGFDGDGVHE